jgi:hypothetical protein
MAKAKQSSTKPVHESVHKRTQSGGNKPKTSSMNKASKRSFKKNRGQGR